VVSRTWRKVKADWENWNRCSLAGDDIVRLILAERRCQPWPAVKLIRTKLSITRRCQPARPVMLILAIEV
jgi:hypothetical protein